MKIGFFHRLTAAMMFTVLSFMWSGCAAIIRGTSQTVRVATSPSGRTVRHEGFKVADGQSVTVRKHLNTPEFEVGNGVTRDMTYDPDLWLIGDIVLLIAVPLGLVALGVDFGTGSWRNLHNPQVVAIPDMNTQPAVEEKKADSESPAPAPAPAKPAPKKKKPEGPKPAEPEPSPIQP